ncbi:MAG: metal ABC transporter permease [Armatimonadetes bacterium]|nr:metal ABC transporter permease [Armatimonadota bacterium]
MRPALLVGVMVAVVCAYLGFYVILKRVVFLGLALAEVSSAGVALGLAISVNPVLVSIGTMLVGVVAFSVKWSARRIPQDAFIGVGFAFASAAALLLVASSPVGEAHMLDLLRGDILTVQPWELFATGIGLGFVAILHLLFTKELLFVSFDPETAAASGYNVRMWEMALFLSVGLTIALGIHATGVLFTSGALVIPATTALLLSKRFTQCAIIAVALGALPVPVGLYISFVTDMSASASVVAVSFALLVVAAIGVRASHR